MKPRIFKIFSKTGELDSDSQRWNGRQWPFVIKLMQMVLQGEHVQRAIDFKEVPHGIAIWSGKEEILRPKYDRLA